MREKVVIGTSHIGKGLFATKNLKKDENVLHIRGKILSAEKINEIGGTFQDNTYRYGPETYLSPDGELGNYLNHSCEPNSKIVKQGRDLFVVSISDIAKGEEIFIDYSTILAADDTWVMPAKCDCGNAQCRKTIKRYTSMPKTAIKKYLDRGLIPQYILKISDMA